MNDLRETPEEAGLQFREWFDPERNMAVFIDVQDPGKVEYWVRRPDGFSGAGLLFDNDPWEFVSSERRG